MTITEILSHPIVQLFLIIISVVGSTATITWRIGAFAYKILSKQDEQHKEIQDIRSEVDSIKQDHPYIKSQLQDVVGRLSSVEREVQLIKSKS